MELPGFESGDWWVQNIAASVPARLLGAGEGRAALDLCTAPGGKAMQLAANGWHVTGVERDGARLDRVRDNLARTELSAELVTADVLKWSPTDLYDAILLDAPCSATGIFARHPDVLHRVRPRDIAELAAIQTKMLVRAADWLKPGGKLVYATCSLEPEEGEGVVAAALAAGLRLDSVVDQELPAGLRAASDGTVRIFPHNHMDGFFVARFARG